MNSKTIYFLSLVCLLPLTSCSQYIDPKLTSTNSASAAKIEMPPVWDIRPRPSIISIDGVTASFSQHTFIRLAPGRRNLVVKYVEGRFQTDPIPVTALIKPGRRYYLPRSVIKQEGLRALLVSKSYTPTLIDKETGENAIIAIGR